MRCGVSETQCSGRERERRGINAREKEFMVEGEEGSYKASIKSQSSDGGGEDDARC